MITFVKIGPTLCDWLILNVPAVPLSGIRG